MSRLLFKSPTTTFYFNLNKTVSCLGIIVFSARFVHRNHPGHKPKPPAIPRRNELPDVYLSEAIYPPVKPKFPPGEWPADYDPVCAWRYFADGQKYHSLKTIQERLSVQAYMNVQQTINDLGRVKTKYRPIFEVSAKYKQPRMLSFNQYITKTHIEPVDSIDNLKPVDPSAEEGGEKVELNKSISPDLYEKIKHLTKEAILVNFATSYVDASNERQETKWPANQLIKGIFDTVTSALSAQDSHEHLVHAQYGKNVDIKGFWMRAGFGEARPRGAVFPDPDSIRFQFADFAAYQIKCKDPLRPLHRIDSKSCTEPVIEDCAYTPATFRVFAEHILPMQVPGHWYGDKREFNYMTVLDTTSSMRFMQSHYPDHDESLNIVKSIATMTGHAELTAQAYYLGFSRWKDITYPLVGQYVMTNGQDFSFANYQLNTIRLWNQATSASNLCYITPSKRLYQVNEERSKITDFDDNLFKTLLNSLSKQPVAQHEEVFENYSEVDYMVGGTRLRPYLSVQNFEEQLSKRHQLFATSLYELVKYDKPMSYLSFRSDTIPVGEKSQFHRLYSKYTSDYRDIVYQYYPRDFYGLELVHRSQYKHHPKQSEKYWDLKQPVFEWANVPPPTTNNVPRNIDLPTF